MRVVKCFLCAAKKSSSRSSPSKILRFGEDTTTRKQIINLKENGGNFKKHTTQEQRTRAEKEIYRKKERDKERKKERDI